MLFHKRLGIVSQDGDYTLTTDKNTLIIKGIERETVNNEPISLPIFEYFDISNAKRIAMRPGVQANKPYAYLQIDNTQVWNYYNPEDLKAIITALQPTS